MKRTGLRRRRKVDPERAHRDAVRAAAATGSDDDCRCAGCLAMRGESAVAAELPPPSPRPRPSVLRRRERERRGVYRNQALLQATRLMGCAFCPKRAPVTAHHFPPKSTMGTTDDRLACPACGDGVRGCHGRAQRYEIPAEEQLAAVGRTLRTHVLAERVTMEEALEAIERVPRLDWRELLQLAVAVRGAGVVEP